MSHLKAHKTLSPPIPGKTITRKLSYICIAFLHIISGRWFTDNIPRSPDEVQTHLSSMLTNLGVVSALLVSLAASAFQSLPDSYQLQYSMLIYTAVGLFLLSLLTSVLDLLALYTVPKPRLQEFADNFSFILALPGLFIILGVIVYVPSQILWGWVQTNSNFFLYYALALASIATIFFFYIWFIIYLYLDRPDGSWEVNKIYRFKDSSSGVVEEEDRYTENTLHKSRKEGGQDS